MCRDLLRQTPVRAESRDELQKALTRPSGGVVFTTIQKFAPVGGETEYPALTDRRNSDEARDIRDTVSNVANCWTLVLWMHGSCGTTPLRMREYLWA